MTENPPAFPSVCLGDPCHPESIPGMLLRDWFAGQALAGMLTSPANDSVPMPKYADAAYQIADAMLAARTQSGSAEHD